MINAILKGIMSLVIGLVNVLLTPIDLAIQSALPDLSSGISAIGSFFSLALHNIGFAISLTGLSSTAISLIILYFFINLLIICVILIIIVFFFW